MYHHPDFLVAVSISMLSIIDFVCLLFEGKLGGGDGTPSVLHQDEKSCGGVCLELLQVRMFFECF
jgi:hypothetical protein